MDEQDDHQTGFGGGSPFWLDKSGCKEAIHTLYHFLDGELTEQRRLEITQHLDECGPCLDAFDFEAELKTVIARKCRDQVPEALRDRVHRALMEQSRMPGSTEYGWE
ncbi:MAG: mycothiol system anti-sigma-R factor [Actinomycetota bacterium]|nr:mycothiol system anti-sigma-R factor [Actinomycetota bacterium]